MQFVQIKAWKTKAIVGIVLQINLYMQIEHLKGLYSELFGLCCNQAARKAGKTFAEIGETW